MRNLRLNLIYLVFFFLFSILIVNSYNTGCDKYGIRIGPFTSLSCHRTIDLKVDSAIARWCDDDDAMAR